MRLKTSPMYEDARHVDCYTVWTGRYLITTSGDRLTKNVPTVAEPTCSLHYTQEISFNRCFDSV
jgi:hypothetical protein